MLMGPCVRLLPQAASPCFTHTQGGLTVATLYWQVTTLNFGNVSWLYGKQRRQEDIAVAGKNPYAQNVRVRVKAEVFQ